MRKKDEEENKCRKYEEKGAKMKREMQKVKSECKRDWRDRERREEKEEENNAKRRREKQMRKRIDNKEEEEKEVADKREKREGRR